MRKTFLLRRRSQRGAALAFFAVTAVALIGLMGISIYTGLQAYFQNELTKTAHTAAMAGAASYYSAKSGYGRPLPNPGYAQTVANQVYTTIRANSPAMQSFNTALTPAPVAANNEVTVGLRGTFNTPFLALVGTETVQVNSLSRARSVRYVPTNETGPIQLNAQGTPAPGQADAYAFDIKPMKFPMIDGTGTEMVIYQSKPPLSNTVFQQGYLVFACNSTTCYNLSRNARLMKGSRFSPNNPDIIYGGCYIDLTEAGVNKATRIRIVDDGVFDAWYGNRHFLLTNQNIKNSIDRVEIYGYASACPTVGVCTPPTGFEDIT